MTWSIRSWLGLAPPPKPTEHETLRLKVAFFEQRRREAQRGLDEALRELARYHEAVRK